MITNLGVIKAFTRKSKIRLSSHNLHIIDNFLYSWDTCIAEIIDDIIFVNLTKYSKSTSNHVRMLINNIPYCYIKVYLDNVPLGTTKLSTLDGNKIVNI